MTDHDGTLPQDHDGIAGTGIKLGATLYSMTSEFAAGLYTPEALIAAVAENGIGPGVEFNIAQLLRTYPDVDDAFVKLWFDSLERYGLEASAVGTNLDMGRRKDRDMTPDEEHEFFARQLKRWETLWFVADRPDVLIDLGRAPEPDERITVEVALTMRLLYMQIVPGADGGPGRYVTNRVPVEREVVLA